jgi:hypothetical protein
MEISELFFEIFALPQELNLESQDVTVLYPPWTRQHFPLQLASPQSRNRT